MDANVTDGKREISFLKALLRRDIGDAHGAIDSLRQEIAHDGGAPRPSTKVLHPQPILFIHNIYLSSHLSIKFQELPGSGFRAPTSYDLDGWSCVIEVAELKKLLPCGASLTTGVDAPASSRKLTSKATLRYLGTMNNVQVFVPEDKYEGLFRSMIRVTRRVILPSRHRNVSAITNCADLMMAEALVAMEQAGIEHVALRAYGSKASLEARRAPGANGAVDYTIVKSRGYSWVGPVLTNSVRGTVDVAAVWETGESNLFRFRSRSERPTGRIDLFPIGILLQSTREVMNYLTENPDDLSLTGFEHRASETAGTLTLWPSFLRETWRRKLTRAQGKSFPFVVTDLECQGAKEYFGHGLFMPCGSEVSDGGGGGGGGGGDDEDDDQDLCGISLARDDGDPDPEYIGRRAIGHSGVLKVCVYNNHERHAGTALEIRKYSKIGHPRGKKGSALTENDLQRDARSLQKVLSGFRLLNDFGDEYMRGGVRIEAKVAFQRGTFPYQDAVRSGVNCARAVGDSRIRYAKSKPTNQTNQPTNQPTYLPTYLPTDRPTYQLTDRPTNQPTKQQHCSLRIGTGRGAN